MAYNHIREKRHFAYSQNVIANKDKIRDMNFEEALELKTKIGDNFTIEGQTIGKVLVTPKVDNDFTIYMENYLLNNFDDISARKFSSNGQYKVTAIYSNNGNYIIKNLTYQHVQIGCNE